MYLFQRLSPFLLSAMWKKALNTARPGVMGFSNCVKKKHKTAGLIVIGDEILKGDVEDTNSCFSCKVLHSMGVKMRKISVVGDDVKDVSDEVAAFSKLFDFVITTGGIGPTHDDVTFEGVAKAFGEPLVTNPEIQAICEKYKQEGSKIKLSKIPESAKLKYYPELEFPSIRVKNVFIFPGIPQHFETTFGIVANDCFQCSNRFYTKCIYLNATEEQILTNLNLLVQLCPKVEFGSYPILCNQDYMVKITIESSDEEATNDAYSKLFQIIPETVIVKT